MEFYQSEEELKRTNAHLKLAYEREKKALEESENRKRLLQEQLLKEQSKRDSILSSIHSKLDQIKRKSDVNRKMECQITETAKMIESQCNVSDAYNVEKNEILNDVKANVNQTMAKFDVNAVETQIEALQVKKQELESQLQKREIVIANLMKRLEATKDNRAHILDQARDQQLELQRQIHDFEVQLLEKRFNSDK